MRHGGLPVVVLPISNARVALDACLASLARTLPGGSAVRIIDDASSDPQLEPMVRGWCERSGLDARYQRQPSRSGVLRALKALLDDSDSVAADADVVVLGADAITCPSWLQSLATCAGSAPDVFSLVPWSNRDELAAFPQLRAPNPRPTQSDGDAIAAAARALAIEPPLDFPPSIGACIYLRRAALDQVGGLDSNSFHGSAGLDDVCRRASALGWRHALCPSAYVARQDDELPRNPESGDDRDRLLARWPDQRERIARCFLDDPMRGLRAKLQGEIDRIAAGGPQRDLFA